MKRPPYINNKYLLSLGAAYNMTPASVPQQMVFSPNGQLLGIADVNFNTVQVFQVATGTLLHSFPVGVTPFSLVWSPDGSFFFTANNSDNTVSKVAYPSGVVTTIAVGTGPVYLGITPDGSLLFCANATSKDVTRIVIGTGATSTIGTGGVTPNGLDVSIDGRWCAVALLNDSVMRIRIATSATTFQALTPASGVDAAAFSPDCISCWVTAFTANAVFKVNINTLAFTTISFAALLPGYQPITAVVSPDGSTLYVLLIDATFTVGAIIMLNTQTNALHSIASPTSNFIACAPLGALVAVANFATSQLQSYHSYGVPL